MGKVKLNVRKPKAVGETVRIDRQAREKLEMFYLETGLEFSKIVSECIKQAEIEVIYK